MHLHEENTKPSVNAEVPRMFEFSGRPQIFYGFYKGEGRSDGTVVEWGRDGAGMLMFLWLCFLSPHYGTEECC